MNEVNAQVSFHKSSQQFGNNRSNSISLIDIDNDGDLDAFVLSYIDSESNTKWINNGKGVFTNGGKLLEATVSNGIAFEDLDGDTDLDIFLTKGYYNNEAMPSEVWLNDGNMNFINTGQKLGSKNSGDVGLADLDGDRDFDAFVCNHILADGTNGGHQIWLNDGKGNFTSNGQTLGNGYCTGLNMGDVDGDGDIDAFVTYNSGNDGNLIWLNDGKGAFTKGNVVGTKFSLNAKLADLDGDTDLDVFITHVNFFGSTNKEAEVWINDGKGNFTNSGQLLGSNISNSIALGDMDKDGDLDAYIANGSEYRQPEPNTIWINDGKAKFTKNNQSFEADRSNNLKLGDLDGDGDLDAFIVTDDGNKVFFNVTGESPVGLIQNKEFENIKVYMYPNPTSGQFTVSFGAYPIQKAVVEIFNTKGVLVYLNTFRNTITGVIDLTGNASGAYVIRIIADEIVFNDVIVLE